MNTCAKQTEHSESLGDGRGKVGALWRNYGGNTILRQVDDDNSLDLRSGLGVGLRCCTYFVSCRRRRAFEASPAPRPRYHLNITWDAAVCRRLYFYTTEIICGLSQRTLSHGRRYGSRATPTHWRTTLSDTCRRSDAHGANDGRSASGVPLGLRPAAAARRPVQYAPLHSLHMAPRDNASTESRPHYTHEMHRRASRCNSLTPTLHCQVFSIICIATNIFGNAASNRPAISQHN